MNVSRFLLAVPALVAAANAFAALGGTAQSVQVDRQALNAAYSTASSGALTVHTLSRPGGSTVREFTDHSGQVVGVAWTGKTMPDLQQILGSTYFARLSAKNQSNGRRIASHRILVIEQPDIVIETQGTMHTGFTGRAYLTSALAAGATADQFK